MNARFGLWIMAMAVSPIMFAACGDDEDDGGGGGKGTTGGEAGEPSTGGTAGTAGSGDSGATGGTGGRGGTAGMSGAAGAPGGEGGMGGQGGEGGGGTGAGIEGPAAFGTIDQSGIGKGACTGEVEAQIWTLTNENGLVAKLTDFGATLVELHVPDKDGVNADIVQGFDSVDGYAASQFAGATVGRVGNRIANGTFTVGTMSYTVTDAGPATANPPNHSLHGGPCGWDKQLWTAVARNTADGPEIEFSLTSPAGDMGFPGEVEATSTYTLTNDNELRIVMTATTDAATPINMLHHSYFNLGGVGSGSVYLHELQIFADQYTPAVTAAGPNQGVPDGNRTNVASTPFDFRTAHTIGRDAALAGVGDQMPPGYDHNWVVNGTPGMLRNVARVRDPESGRVMTIQADQPGVQFYTTNYRPLPGAAEPHVGKNGIEYYQHEALALETQKHPNAINFAAGTDAADELIEPTETYSHTMVHTFTVEP
jgi:aldose 1-epimerase